MDRGDADRRNGHGEPPEVLIKPNVISILT